MDVSLVNPVFILKMPVHSTTCYTPMEVKQISIDGNGTFTNARSSPIRFSEVHSPILHHYGHKYRLYLPGIKHALCTLTTQEHGEPHLWHQG